MRSVEEIIDLLGGPEAAAGRCGVGTEAIRKWRQARAIPAKHWPAILTATGEKFFCPGWDLKAAAEGEAPDSDYGVGGFGGIQELPGLNNPYRHP